MDFLKLFLTFVLALFFGLFAYAFSSGFVLALRNDVGQFSQVACAIGAILFLFLTLWALRQMYRQVTSSRRPVRKAKALKLRDIVHAEEQLRPVANGDMSDVTGAGWMLVIVSLVVPIVGVAAFCQLQFGEPDEMKGLNKLIGWVIAGGALVIFSLGRWLLSQFGVHIVLPKAATRNKRTMRRKVRRFED